MKCPICGRNFTHGVHAMQEVPRPKNSLFYSAPTFKAEDICTHCFNFYDARGLAPWAWTMDMVDLARLQNIA